MFEINLKKCLGRAEKMFSESGKDGFVIDISKDKLVLFQIISSNLLTGQPTDKLSYTIYLSFDEDFSPEAAKEEERLKTLSNYNAFSHSEFDGINIYQTELVYLEEVRNTVREIVEKVYEIDPDAVEIDIQE